MTWTPPEVKPSTARRRANEKRNKADRRRIRNIKGVWPVEDPTYRDWIRTLPCAACCMGYRPPVGPAGASGRRMTLVLYMEFIDNAYSWAGRESDNQCAHVGDRGLRQKCSDRETLPLCGKHHDRGQPEGHHDLGKTFWTYHGMNRDLIVKALNCFYDRREFEVQGLNA